MQLNKTKYNAYKMGHLLLARYATSGYFVKLEA